MASTTTCSCIINLFCRVYSLGEAFAFDDNSQHCIVAFFGLSQLCGVGCDEQLSFFVSDMHTKFETEIRKHVGIFFYFSEF